RSPVHPVILQFPRIDYVPHRAGSDLFEKGLPQLLICGPGVSLDQLDKKGPGVVVHSLPLPDAPHPLAWLCAPRRERPRYRPAQPYDERAPPHSITSSARASSEGGTARPIVLAVLRLITSSNLVACTTGRSAGLTPLRT